MLITFSPNDLLQLVVDERIYVIQYDESKRYLTINRLPLTLLIEQYQSIQPSEQFLEKETNTKIEKI